ncbi:M48 family metalloprotease, partial [Escherichia coli]
ANALTLTDGTIIITDELVNLIEDENELVSVLLHEMGHHYHHHIMNSLVSSSSLKFVSMWILRKSSGIEDILLNSGNQLMTLSYSRDMELEAD